MILQAINLKMDYKLKKRSLFRKPGVVQALRGVSFEIAKGESFAFVGESGCGKSTTARILVNLEEPTSGTVRFRDKTIHESHQSDIRRSLQIVLQDPYSSLPEHMTIHDILMEPLNIHDIGQKSDRRNKVGEIAEMIGLQPGDLSRNPNEFSGGQRQMINIGRAIILNPEVVILDEATSSLDMSIQAEILNILQSLREQFNLTYVVISHDIAVVRHLCDTIAVMYLGKIVEYGANDEVLHHPRHPYTKSLLSVIPSVDDGIPALKNGTLVKGEVPSAINPPRGCAFAARCPLRTEVCTQVDPELKTAGSRHYVACHNA